MRFRTAGILSVVLIGGMFCLPAAVSAVFLPSLNQGLPVPGYERILLGLAEFCGRFRWFLALPIVTVLFTFAAISYELRARVRQ